MTYTFFSIEDFFRPDDDVLHVVSRFAPQGSDLIQQLQPLKSPEVSMFDRLMVFFFVLMTWFNPAWPNGVPRPLRNGYMT